MKRIMILVVVVAALAACGDDSAPMTPDTSAASLASVPARAFDGTCASVVGQVATPAYIASLTGNCADAGTTNMLTSAECVDGRTWYQFHDHLWAIEGQPFSTADQTDAYRACQG